MTLGLIPFLNCVPFFARLKESGFAGDFVPGVPSALNRMLQEGALDVSPSSSFEYAYNWNDYLILNHHSIASQGAVKSVLLFSPVDLVELDGRNVFLTGESATSINLLRVLLREFCHLDTVTDSVPDVPVEDLIRRNEPGLLIGDRALRMAQDVPTGIRIFDLGDLWSRYTGLPFVFALWMIRKEVVSHHQCDLQQLGEQLMASRSQVLNNPQPYAQQAAKETGFSVDTIIAYWNTIDYDFGPSHKQGLKLFFDLCFKHGLLKDQPMLHFLDA